MVFFVNQTFTEINELTSFSQALTIQLLIKIREAPIQNTVIQVPSVFQVSPQICILLTAQESQTKRSYFPKNQLQKQEKPEQLKKYENNKSQKTTPLDPHMNSQGALHLDNIEYNFIDNYQKIISNQFQNIFEIYVRKYPYITQIQCFTSPSPYSILIIYRSFIIYQLTFFSLLMLHVKIPSLFFDQIYMMQFLDIFSYSSNIKLLQLFQYAGATSICQLFVQIEYEQNIIQLIYKTFMLFKVVYKNQIHVMNSKETITYGKLEEFIKSVFKKLPAKYTLTYKDSDQDMICLLNDVDMKIMFQSGLNKVRIQIQECSEDFYDPTQQIVIQAEPVQKVEEPKVIIPEVSVPEVQIQEVKVPEVVPEKIEKSESCISEVKSIDDSISQKLSQMMPEIISKIKEQVLTESKIREPKKVEEEMKEKTEVKPESSNSQVVHAHVTCDECQASPIVGIRYKCVVCPDFDICEKCEAKSTHAHPFLKIKHLHQTPIKIFAVIDDQDESLEINGQKVPLPGLNQGIQDGLNLLTGLFGGRKPEECRESFKKCRDHWKKFAHHMKDNMRANCPYFQAQKDQKVEEKVEVPKAEQKIEVPKTEVKVEAPKPEQKKEQPKTQPVITEEKKPEQLLVETANYISEIMNVDFRKAYRFAANYPGQTKEQILMKYLEK